MGNLYLKLHKYKAVFLSVCTDSSRIVWLNCNHSFYSPSPSSKPSKKIYKQNYTHIVSSRYLDPYECAWCFPATRFSSPASAFWCQQKHDTLLTAVSVLDMFPQNAFMQKGAKAALKSSISMTSFKWHSLPLVHFKPPLHPPGQKKEKSIKPRSKPFRSLSFEHIHVFLSKIHHSTINHKSP